MKRVISFIIMLSMVLTMFTGVFAASVNENGTEEVPLEAKILDHFGILTFSTEEFGKDKTVSRAEFCCMVTRLLKVDGHTVGESPFEDVTENTDYANSIIYLYEMGVISGGGNNFMPYEPIEVAAALKIVTGILKYGDVAAYMGGYPTGYLTLGNKLGITGNMKNFDVLTRRDCASLLYNAMNVEFADYYVNNGNSMFTVEDDGTILGCYFGFERRRGRMTANTITSLTGVKYRDDAKVTVDGKTYSVKNTDFNDLLGLEIEYYTDNDNNLEFAVDRGKSETVEIPLKNVIKSKTSVKNGVYYYDENNREKNLKIDSEADYIVNGTAYPDFKFNDIADYQGSIRLVDFDSNGTYDVVFYSHYYNFVVADYSQESELLRGEDNKEIDFSDIKDVNVSIIDASGEAYKLTELKEKDVLSVYVDKHKKYYNIILSNEIVAGKIAEKNDRGNVTEIKLNEIVYEINDNSDVDTADFKVGDDCVLYLDYLGEVAYADFEKLTDMNYGFMIKMAVEKNSLSKLSRVQLMTQNGNIMIFDIAEKIKLNGSYTDASGKAYTQVSVCDAPVFYDGGVFKPQLIRYKLNKDKEINCIETANAQTDDNTLKLNATLSGNNSRWMINQNGFYFRYGVQDEVVIFKVPPISNGTVDEAKMDVIKTGDLIGSRFYEGAQIYDCDEVNAAKCIVIPSEYVDVSRNNCFVIEKTGLALDDDKNEVAMIKGWYQGGEITLLSSADIDGIDERILELSIGDIIGPILDSKNQIIGFDLFLEADKAADFVNTETKRAGFPYQTCGIVKARKGRVVRVALKGLEESGDDVYRIREAANIYYVNLTDKTVDKANVSVIEPQDSASSDVYTYFKFYNDYVYDVVVIKK